MRQERWQVPRHLLCRDAGLDTGWSYTVNLDATRSATLKSDDCVVLAREPIDDEVRFASRRRLIS